MSKRINLYSKFGQITDYLLPLLVLYIAFRGNFPIAGKILLITLAVVFIFLSLKSYRVSVDKENLYLNNLFVHKKINISDVVSIERKPFYYSSSGGIAAFSYKLTYKKGGAIRSAIVGIGKGHQYQQPWNALKMALKSKTY